MKHVLRKLGLVSIMCILIGIIFCQSQVIQNRDSYTSDTNQLPTVVIETYNNQIESYATEATYASIKIYDDTEILLESDIEIKVRGRSSRGFPKKQYNIKLVDEVGNGRNKKVLGMPKESDWALNGSYIDRSFIRNYIAFEVAGEIMPYAPRVEFCKVYLVDDAAKEVENKHYQGIYLMIEKIKRDDQRVDIQKVSDKYEEISYIAQRNQNNRGIPTIEVWGEISGYYENELQVVYPSTKNITPQQIEYISQDVSKFEKILFSTNFDDSIDGYRKYIDVNSFIDYFIINEYFANIDGGALSTFFYKDIGGKITMGPVWDFDSAMGNYQWYVKEDREIYEQSAYKEFVMIDKPWFHELLQDTEFVEEVIKRYRELRKTYLSDKHLLALINDAVELLGQEPIEDEKKWRSSLDLQPSKVRTYKEDIEYLKTFLVERGKWLDKHIGDLHY